MSHIIEVTLSNQLSDGMAANSTFDMKVFGGGPVLNAGTIAWEPRDVGSLTSKPSNAGIYQSSASVQAIEGVVAYTLPGISKSILVIYFSNSKCRLLRLADTTTITSDIIQQAKDEENKMVDGTLIVPGVATINWEAKEESSVVGTAAQYIVTVRGVQT
ncbi:hypothetical protein B0H14DRAFT_2678586 [Mycena olivaceomarginata]|nr:hypothetical protein B0H14DRAFT_2678586 [Mycena olivaceomarginata]